MSRIPFRRRSSELRAAAVEAPGQSLAEYAVIIAAIAVACMIAVLFLVAGIRGRFDSTSGPTPAAPFDPPTSPAPSYPTTSPAPSYPTSLKDCEDGGWMDYVELRFEDEQACKKYVKEHSP